MGWACIIPYSIFAQTAIASQESEVVIESPQISKTNPLNIDLFFYGAWSMGDSGNPYNYSSSAVKGGNRLYGSFIDVGIGGEIYRTPNDQWRLGANIGYKYERFGFDKGLFRDLGIKSHWISTDLNICWKVFCIGIKSDLFIDSRIKYNDTFTYQGFNDHCFNDIAWGWYGGLNAKFSFIKFEVRLGCYIQPQLDPNAIAYYISLKKAKVNPLYWEAKISYPLFSSRKFFESSIISRTLK